MINIFVRNLDPATTEEQLKDLFVVHGSVMSVTIVKDRDTLQPRGFAFVEMATTQEAKAAIATLHGFPLNGHNLVVNEARPKREPESARDTTSREHRRHRT